MNYRKHSAGSCIAARLAGSIPNTNPTLIEIVKLKNTLIGETIVSISVAA
jgi:hypothetical protein